MNKIVYILFIVWFFCTVLSCSKSDGPIIQMSPSEPQKYTYLALGDSYTIGEGVPENLRWPIQLSARLNTFGKDITKVKIIAQTGWTTNNLINAIENADPEDHDLVSLLIGVNNQYQSSSFSQFKSEFDTLLNMSVDLANGKQNVFVVSIPDYGITPFGANNSQHISEEIDAYNSYIEQRCNALEIAFINITEISRELGDNSAALAPDQLHPSGSQYSLWVAEMLPVVLNLLD